MKFYNLFTRKKTLIEIFQMQNFYTKKFAVWVHLTKCNKNNANIWILTPCSVRKFHKKLNRSKHVEFEMSCTF